MFLRRLVTQAAEGTVVAKDGERPSERPVRWPEEFCWLKEKEMKSRTMKNLFSLHREPAVRWCAGRASEQVQKKRG